MPLSLPHCTKTLTPSSVRDLDSPILVLAERKGGSEETAASWFPPDAVISAAC
jgi:hypothetical protein